MREERIATPLGPMIALVTGRGLSVLEFDSPSRRGLWKARLNRYFAEEKGQAGSANVLHRARRWLDAYFAGDFDSLPDVPLDLRGTDFERKVWRGLCAIRPGKVMTYGALASLLRRPGAARAVGSGCRRNPVGLIVPCHRVIGKQGGLTGYGGGLKIKAWLLEHEERRS